MQKRGVLTVLFMMQFHVFFVDNLIDDFIGQFSCYVFPHNNDDDRHNYFVIFFVHLLYLALGLKAGDQRRINKKRSPATFLPFFLIFIRGKIRFGFFSCAGMVKNIH